MLHYINKRDTNEIITLDFSDFVPVKFYLVGLHDTEYNDYCCLCNNDQENQNMLKRFPYFHCFDLNDKILVFLPQIKEPKCNVVNNYLFPNNISLYIGLFNAKSRDESELIEMYKTVKFYGDSFDVIKVVLRNPNEVSYPSVSLSKISLWELFRFPLNSYSRKEQSKYVSKFIDQNIFEINLKDTLNWFKI